MAIDTNLDIEVSFKDENPLDVMTILEKVSAQNVENVSQRGLTGIEFVIVGTLAVSALSNLILKLLPLWKCGVIVDARGKKIVTKKNCDLPQGTVLVIHPDGTEAQLNQPADIDMKSLIAELLPGKDS